MSISRRTFIQAASSLFTMNFLGGYKNTSARFDALAQKHHFLNDAPRSIPVFKAYYKDNEGREWLSRGSGILAHTDGRIVTAAHGMEHGLMTSADFRLKDGTVTVDLEKEAIYNPIYDVLIYRMREPSDITKYDLLPAKWKTWWKDRKLSQFTGLPMIGVGWNASEVLDAAIVESEFYSDFHKASKTAAAYGCEYISTEISEGSLGPGTSGGPVFDIQDGSVVAMIRGKEQFSNESFSRLGITASEALPFVQPRDSSDSAVNAACERPYLKVQSSGQDQLKIQP